MQAARREQRCVLLTRCPLSNWDGAWCRLQTNISRTVPWYEQAVGYVPSKERSKFRMERTEWSESDSVGASVEFNWWVTLYYFLSKLEPKFQRWGNSAPASRWIGLGPAAEYSTFMPWFFQSHETGKTRTGDDWRGVSKQKQMYWARLKRRYQSKVEW